MVNLVNKNWYCYDRNFMYNCYYTSSKYTIVIIYNHLLYDIHTRLGQACHCKVRSF
jgi:hypothetical protein